MSLPSKVSEQVRALNPHLFGDQALTTKLAQECVTFANERKLQDACEQWLESQGYVRLTAANAMAAKSPRGWFGHLAQPKGNAFMPDVFVFTKGRPALLVELKVREDYRPGQLAMIERGDWVKATNLSEFKALVVAWEKENI